MLSIKKTYEISKDKDFIKHLGKIHNLKIESDFIIFKDVISIYKNGKFKAIETTKLYHIKAETNKTFDLHMSLQDFNIHYKMYQKKIKP